jgi:hypothetical protein
MVFNLGVELGPAPNMSGTVYGGYQFAAVLVSGAVMEIIDPPENIGLATRTNAQGQYRLSGIRVGTGDRAGMFIVKITHPDFQTKTQTYTMVVGGDHAGKNFLLDYK